MRRTLAVLGVLGLMTSHSKAASAAPWIRSGIETPKQLWGIEGGILIAIWPSGIEGDAVGGPRGLFRVGYHVQGDQGRLINFIAVEPIVASKARGLSELEASRFDGQKGKVFAPASRPAESFSPDGLAEHAARRPTPSPGWIDHPDPALPNVERLNVEFFIEAFHNGAHPRVVASIRMDRPDEVAFRVEAEPDSKPMSACVLTATMGNYMRARRLWLADRVVEARDLWPDFQGDGFAPPRFFDRSQLLSTAEDDVWAAITTDEDDPAAVVPLASPFWRYRAEKRTQRWRIPAGMASAEAQLKVNGRCVYWASKSLIPGGTAFENFELVEPFRPGQVFVFGLTKESPPLPNAASRR